MNAKLNINAIMCEKVDTKVTKIENIFNSAKMDENGMLSFNVVTFVNYFGEPTGFTIAFFLQHRINENDGPTAFLNAIEYKYEGENVGAQNVQNAHTMYYPNVNLDGEGHYLLLVYVYEDSELKEKGIDFREDDENWIGQLEKEHIACIYEFDVRK